MKTKKWYYRVYLVKSSGRHEETEAVVVNRSSDPNARLFVKKEHRGKPISFLLQTDNEMAAYKKAEHHNHFYAAKKDPKITRRWEELQGEENSSIRHDLQKQLEDSKVVRVYSARKGAFLRTYPTAQAAARELGFQYRTIMRVINGVKPSHQGLVFRRGSDKTK